MKIERNGSKLTIKVDSGIGWTLNFESERGNELNAEALRVHCQAKADADAKVANDRLQYAWNMEREACRRYSRECRRNAALRGVITKMKKRGQP